MGIFDNQEQLPAKNEGRRGATALVTPRIAGISAIPPRMLGPAIARLRVLHNAAADIPGSRPGQLRLRKEAFDKLDVRFLVAHPYRVYTVASALGLSTLCASANGIEPLASIPKPQAVACRTCSRAQWDHTPSGKAIPPECQEGIVFLGVTAGERKNIPFWFECRRTALREATSFIAALNQDEGIEYLSDAVVELSTLKRSSGGVVWYVPFFNVTEISGVIEYRKLTDSVQAMRYEPDVTHEPEDTAQEGEVPF